MMWEVVENEYLRPFNSLLEMFLSAHDLNTNLKDGL